VSPSTNPGSRPRAPSGNPADARLSALRTDPAARCHHGGLSTSVGSDCANSVTESDPASSAGCSTPATRTRCPGSTPRHICAGARTSTPPPTRMRRPPTRTDDTLPCTAASGEPATPLAASGRGSAATRSSTVAGTCCRASWLSGDARLRARRPANGMRTRAMQNPTSATVDARRTPRWVAASAASPTPQQPAATASSAPGEAPRQTSIASQAPAAPSASRASRPAVIPSPADGAPRTLPCRCQTPRRVGRRC
jgi:hypothetical protein